MVNLSKFYQPHEGQQKVHASTAKYKTNQAGRRWGKDRCGLGELMKNYLQWLQDYADGKRDQWLEPGFHCWVVVPTMAQGRQIWHEMLRFIPPSFISRKQDEEQIIYLRGPSGATYGLIELKSAHDPEGLQTVGLDFLWISEAQDMQDRAWEKLYPITTSAGRYGLTYVNGIPSMWPDHWWQRLCEAASRDDSGRMEYFHFSAFDNPLLDENDLADIELGRESMTEAAWRRMYLAEFSLNSGFFRNIDGCISGDTLDMPLPGRAYIGGIDFGVSNDATVFTIMDMESRRVVQRYRYDSTSWPDSREHIASVHREWNLMSIPCDTSNMGGIVMFEELQQDGLPVEDYKFQGENRQTYLRHLQVAIERSTISFPHIDSLIRELRQFQYIRNRDGRYKVQAPQGERDDEVMALALALQACNAPVPLRPMNPHGIPGSGRRVPTQDEMNGMASPLGVGARELRKIHSNRLVQRARDAGVLV